jgi:hypothetical protein
MIETAEHGEGLLANRLVVRLVSRDGENRLGNARRNRLHAVGRATHVRERAARVSRGSAVFFAIVTSVGAVFALSASIAGKSASRPARPSILPASESR